MASEMPGSSTQEHPFERFNMNCYYTFPTERGLCSHLWHSALCKKNMLEDRPYALYQEMSDVTHLHPAYYGLQSTRLDPTMSTSVPLFSPFDEFDYLRGTGTSLKEMKVTKITTTVTMTTMDCWL